MLGLAVLFRLLLALLMDPDAMLIAIVLLGAVILLLGAAMTAAEKIFHVKILDEEKDVKGKYP